MRILWVVTKPPWPMRDGGRVVVAHTLRALAADGHELVLVSPFDPRADDQAELTAHLRELCEPHLVPASPGPMALSLLRARWQGLPASISRHALPPVKREVDRLLTDRRFDVVHAEQLQALAQCEPARRRSVPVVLRCQNVESDLWSGAAASWPLLRALVGREAARLARHEGLMMRRVASVIALTARDAERLRQLSGETASIHHVPAPFPDRLPPGSERLEGDPAVVVLAGDWRPNRDGAAWLVERVWPDVLARCPRAVLHVFGRVAGVRAARAMVVHGAPGDSRDVFPPGAILAVPLRFASGVRVKILEAWARGVPVVATPEAAAGLDAGNGEELLIARDPRELAMAIQRIHAEPAFALASIEAGRSLLRARHAPERVAGQLADVYGEVARRARG